MYKFKNQICTSMERINIAELLEDCPKGMELYSPIFGKVYLDKIRPHLAIVVTTDKYKEEFLYDGRYGMNGECMLFPSKGKTTWEGFVPPCKFKDGDVVVAEDVESFQLFLLKHLTLIEDDNRYDGYCYFGWDFQRNELFEKGNWGFNRLATKEEKQKLFDAINKHGYKWNEETKSLEKLEEPKFKVGDRIKHKENTSWVCTIRRVTDRYYVDGHPTCFTLLFDNQNEYELVPNKFDINTLKPFESRVLVRTNNGKWIAAFYSHYDEDSSLHYCVVGGLWYAQCIPYEGNEHLLSTTNDCDEFYKTW